MRSRATAEDSQKAESPVPAARDSGRPGPEKQGSERRCVLTRAVLPPERMVRFVVGPGGAVVPDLAGRLPGRGMWLSASRDVLDNPRTRQAFARAAKERVSVPENLADLVAKGLVQRMLDAVSLARRAGQVVGGFAKCREWITSGKAGLVIRSEGASADELSRLLSGRRSLPVVSVPQGVLGTAFGREKAVYAAMASGALARRLIAEHERFSGVAEGPRPAFPGASPGEVGPGGVSPGGISKEQAEE